MENKIFKKGDWCFCEFELQQINKVEEGRVTEVTTGQMQMSGNDLTDRCFHITMPVKRASDLATYWYKEFDKSNTNSLNYPDLHRKMVTMWVELCEETNQEKLKKLYKKVEAFGSSVLNRIEELRHESIEGVPLFRR